MNYLPSKELLSEVLRHKVWKVLGCNMGTLRYCIYPNKGDEPSEYMFPINIYEVAHKCKEWAYRQGYVLLSGYSAYGVGLFFCSCKGWVSENYDKKIEITHNTEPEAIFKACQWILDNKD